MKPLNIIITLQIVTFSLGVLLSLYSNLVSFPLFAMLLWGGGVSLIMAVFVVTGKRNLLYKYGAKGSILSMLSINIVFMLHPVIDRL